MQYDYSSVHVDVPVFLAEDIIRWGKFHIGDSEIYVRNQEPLMGREDEIHVTILYGLHTENSANVRDLLEKEGPIKIKLGNVGVFTNPFKFDVVMIEVLSPDLNRLNDKLQKGVKFTNRYGLYHPHVTIAYVKKGKGWKHNGFDQWKGAEFMCDYVVFSSKNGIKEKIGLI